MLINRLLIVSMRSIGLMIIRPVTKMMRDWLKPCRCHCLPEEAPAGRVLFCAWLLVACGRSSGQQSGEILDWFERAWIAAGVAWSAAEEHSHASALSRLAFRQGIADE